MFGWKELGKLPAGLWVLAGASLVNRVGAMALPFLALYLTQQLGLSAVHAGVLLAVYGVGALVIAPVGGWLCDRVGPLRVMLASLFLSGGLMMMYPLVRGYPGLLALTLAWSFASEVLRPASFTMMGHLAPPDLRKAAFALNRLSVNLGMSIGPAVGGWLAMRSFTTVFIADAATTLLAGVFVWCFRKRLATPVSPIHHSILRTYGLAWSDPALRYFLLAMTPVTVVFFQLSSTLPLFMVRNLGLEPSDYGLCFTINTLLILALEVPLNTATKRWSARASLSLGALLLATGFGATALATGFWGLAATVVVWTFGEMILLPASGAYLVELAPPSMRGAYMGVHAARFSLCLILAGLAGPWVLEKWGPAWLWGGAFALGMVSVGMLWGVKGTLGVSPS